MGVSDGLWWGARVLGDHEPNIARGDPGTIGEPPNSSVDDWLGQQVDDDAELVAAVPTIDPHLQPVPRERHTYRHGCKQSHAPLPVMINPAARKEHCCRRDRSKAPPPPVLPRHQIPRSSLAPACALVTQMKPCRPWRSVHATAPETMSDAQIGPYRAGAG